MTLGTLTTNRSWTALRDDLMDELRKWGVNRFDIMIPKYEESKRTGRVEVQFIFKGEWRTIACSAFTNLPRGAERNLCAIKETVRSTRLADQRGIGGVLAETAKLMELPDPNDAYHILGVSRDASIDEILRAYRNKLKETHPDRGGSREDFERVREAGQILGVAG